MSLTLIRTRAQREKRAANDFGRHGIATEHWVERRTVRKPKGGRFEVESALAPSYIGAAAPTEAVQHAVRDIETTHEEVYRVTDNRVEVVLVHERRQRKDIIGCLGSARDCELVSLRERNGKLVDDTPKAPAKPAIGSTVAIRSGPFEGWNVKVLALHGNAFSAECRSGSTVVPLRLPYGHLHPG